MTAALLPWPSVYTEVAVKNNLDEVQTIIEFANYGYLGNRVQNRVDVRWLGKQSFVNRLQSCNFFPKVRTNGIKICTLVHTSLCRISVPDRQGCVGGVLEFGGAIGSRAVCSKLDTPEPRRWA